MKHLILSLLFLIGILLQSHAQLTVADDNNVGIGVTEPDSELSIGGVGNTFSTLYVDNSTTSYSQRAAQFTKSVSGTTGGHYSFSVFGNIVQNGGYKLIGAQFQAHASSYTANYRTFGIRGIAGNGYEGGNYGVFGYLYGAKKGAAIYGCTDGVEAILDANYAGYFRGDVKITGNLDVGGSYPSSDINLKKDIRLLSDEESRQIDKLKTLSAFKYKLKNPAELNDFKQEEVDTMKVDPRTIEYTEDKYIRDNIGFSAQEVQLVYPELVKENNDGYLGMNYVGLIPVLVEALKEQDETINLQNGTILALDEVNKLQDEAILALGEANKLQDETISAQNEAIQAQAAKIEVLIEEIEKLKNPETTE